MIRLRYVHIRWLGMVTSAMRGSRAIRVRLVTIALAAGVLSVVRSPPVGAYLYWPDSKQGSVARANLDGGGLVTDFLPVASNSSLGLAVDSRHVYVSRISGVIERADLDGRDVLPDFVDLEPTSSGPGFGYEEIGASLAVGSGYMFWPDHGDDIGRANLAGGSLELRFLKTEEAVAEVVVGAGHIYWVTEGRRIGRANVNGSASVPTLLRLPEATGPIGIAVVGGHIYWPMLHGIAQANLIGADQDLQFITKLKGAPSNLAVAGKYLYWTSTEHRLGRILTWISRASISGNAVQQHLVDITGSVTGRLVANNLGPKRAIRVSTPSKKH
jgi:hypothetical protein